MIVTVTLDICNSRPLETKYYKAIDKELIVLGCFLTNPKWNDINYLTS